MPSNTTLSYYPKRELLNFKLDNMNFIVKFMDTFVLRPQSENSQG